MAYYLEAIQTLLLPTNLLILLTCTAVGIILGAIPGLTGSMGITILLPLTFGLTTDVSFIMLLGMWIGGTSGGFVAATLLGIPGAPSSIATCFDAYPMCQKGQAYRALSIGIVGSFIGTVGSVIIATVLTSYIADWALKLGPWEYFSLCFCAITLVASLVRGNHFKGFLAVFLGLFLAQVGMSPLDGAYRFTFNSIYLSEGVDMLALMLGLYAIKQVIGDFAKGQQQLAHVDKVSTSSLTVLIKDFVHNIGAIIKSFIIGLWIGFLPGMGSGLSNMIAYAQVKGSSKHKDEFGKGHPAGIWASETSNNASIGGAVVPMIALGIPGDAVTALLLSGLTIHGLQAGPLFIQNNPHLANLIFASILVAAVLVLILQFAGVRLFPKLLSLPCHYLYTVIIVMCFVGAFLSTNTIFNLGLMIGFTVLGIIMDYFEIPMSPLILAYILGPKIEEYFRKGINYSNDGIITFFTRPISLIFILIAFIGLAWPLISKLLAKRKNTI